MERMANLDRLESTHHLLRSTFRMVFVNFVIDIFLAAVNCVVLHLVHLLVLSCSGVDEKGLPLHVQGIYNNSPPFPSRTD